jgi:hypothetical protein
VTEERDEKLSAAYRALGDEEPPRALDDAILAASRRPVARPWTRRHAVPLSLAAVLVLSVAVTLRIQHEAPGIESPVSVREQAVPKARAPAAEAPAAEAPAAAEQQAALKLKKEDQLRPGAAREPKPFSDFSADRREVAPPAKSAAPAPAPPAQPALQGRPEESRAELGRNTESSVAGTAARQTEERVARDAEAAARAPQVGPLAALAKRSQASADSASAPAAAPAPAAVAPSPVAEGVAGKSAAKDPRLQELDRIAALRAEGRHEEADKAFLEFRRRHPDFKITEDMLRRIERR